LAVDFPAHVAAEWMGHSTVVADKHYWRVTDADYERAIQIAQQKAQQQASQDTGMDRQPPEKKSESTGNVNILGLPLGVSVLPDGLEPSTY